MTAFTYNPFTWDNSSEAIQSSVTSLELESGIGKKINVSNLEEDIVIVIPLPNAVSNDADASTVTEHSFLKPSKLSFRSYQAQLKNVPVTFEITVEKPNVVLDFFVKSGTRPTIEESDFKITLTFNSTCKNQTTDKLMNEPSSSCVVKNEFSVVPSNPGILYVGLLYMGAKNSSEHSRKRRSCFGHGRQRRSCVGVKDPPLQGIFVKEVSQYEPTKDLNYTIRITQSGCLYWSELLDKWTSDGCKVRRCIFVINIAYIQREFKPKTLSQFISLPRLINGSFKVYIVVLLLRRVELERATYLSSYFAG